MVKHIGSKCRRSKTGLSQLPTRATVLVRRTSPEGNFEIGQFLHLKFEIRNCKLDGQAAAPDFKFLSLQTSSSVNGRGIVPSISVKPYSFAGAADTSTFPEYRSTSGSDARATTARPLNSGDSEFGKSRPRANSMIFSVLTRPG